MKYLLIAAGLGGFAFTLLKEKPPGIYFFACLILVVVVHEMSRSWLTLQFIALQTFMVGAMLSAKRTNP